MSPPRSILAIPAPGQRGADAEPRSWANALPSVPLFAGLSRRQVAKIAKAGRIVRFHDDTAIVRAGEPGDTLYVVLDGEVSVQRPRGRAVTVATGGFFGELSLLDGGPRSATVAARGAVVCFTIRRAVFAKLLRAEPAIAIAILSELAARLRRADHSNG
jgi:CRP/FNR family transcriptional regulator, cyclic AMP receptor protein